MKAVDRAQHWISVDHVLDGTYIEIRIHGETPREDTPTLLTANEARALARSLVLMAEQLEPVKLHPRVGDGKGQDEPRALA